MSFQVAIRQHGAPVGVEIGQTVLEAALAQGVPYPHGCRSGNCGACKSRLEAGEVELMPHSEFALTPEERADGLVLACRAMPWSDAALAWLEVDEVVAHPLRRLACRVTGLDDLTHDTRRVRLEVLSGGPFVFSPGQYAALRFEGLPPRDYSMANRPGDPLLEFHIRRVASGASSRHVAERLRLGDAVAVAVEGPYGASWLRDRHTGPIIAVAGGSGLAPIKSIVDSALEAGMQQPIHLYFGVADERDVYGEPHFRALADRHPNLKVTTVLSAPRAPTGRRIGLVHQAVAEDFAEFDGCKAYRAGPPPLVEAATALFLARGMRREDIHADAFYSEAEKAAQLAGGGT
jgi:CDP-4-dehydro-6-deoxyglucose reductase/ferredoxin-NAD(P)+ reductase (naphthalene dioxygenase ferredoxin-specific)